MAMACAPGGNSMQDPVDFHAIPVRALNVSSRLTLARYLNPEMALTTSTNLARDYRGLAELLGFTYIDLQNFQRYDSPTLKILEAWEKRPESTIGILIDKLQEMERADVIEDTKYLFESDSRAFLRQLTLTTRESPLQVAEVSSCPVSRFPRDDPNHLTLSDVSSDDSDVTYYDAFVCYADEDWPCVYRLSQVLESPEVGIKLCIRDRDLLLGTMTHDALVQLIEDRCNRMLVILSPEFLRSPECEFQTKFATGLAVEQRQRKIIPIMYKHCEIPSLLRFVTKVDYTKTDVQEWMWRKLIVSIKCSTKRDFVDFSSIQHLISGSNTQAALPSSSPSKALPSTLPIPTPSTMSSGIGSLPASTTSMPSISPVSNRRGPMAMFRALKDRINSNSGSSSGYVSQNLDTMSTSSTSNWKDANDPSVGIFYSTT